MQSQIMLPPPTREERISDIATALLSLIVGGSLLVLFPTVLLESARAEGAGFWDFAAMVFVLGFAAFLFWVAWSCRIVALPFRFVVDASNRKCGYRWGSWWTQQVNLTDATKLRGGIFHTITRPYQGNWRWTIYASRKEFDRGFIVMSPPRIFTKEKDAVSDCQQNLRILSEHLRLPSELKPDSP